VEHSRAAHEFLDSLIDMEKSFKEKMRTELLLAGQEGPERLDTLAVIKKRIYDGLHHRIQVFFAPQPDPGEQA
jgi:hypothetical protein